MQKKTSKSEKRKKIAMPTYTQAEILKTLPASVAASVGRTIMKHAYLEWILAKILFNLMHISIKQGRVSFRLPHPSKYVSHLRQHLEFCGINLKNYKFRQLGIALGEADRARNALAHSVYLLHPRDHKIRIQLVTGSWGLDQEYETLHRALHPETPIVDRAFLSEQKRAVNTAFKLVRDLQLRTNAEIRTWNERRRSLPAWDRRTHGQT